MLFGKNNEDLTNLIFLLFKFMILYLRL